MLESCLVLIGCKTFYSTLIICGLQMRLDELCARALDGQLPSFVCICLGKSRKWEIDSLMLFLSSYSVTFFFFYPDEIIAFKVHHLTQCKITGYYEEISSLHACPTLNARLTWKWFIGAQSSKLESCQNVLVTFEQLFEKYKHLEDCKVVNVHLI